MAREDVGSRKSEVGTRPLAYARGSAGLLLVLLASCSHKHIAQSPPQNPTYAVTQNMQRQVQNARDLGEGDYVLRQLRERLAKDPTDLEARLQIADHLKRTGSLDLAIEHYRLAAERFPDNPAVVLLLAKALRDANQPAAALEATVNFCKRHQDAPPELLSLTGIMQDDAGQWAQAEANYRRALEQSPNLSYLHNNLGYNLLQQKRAAEAVAEFKRALTIDPRSEIATNNLALALLTKADPEPREALARWQTIADPATAHNNLASYLIEQGRYKEAHKELDIALKLNHNHPAALRNAQLLAELGNGGQPSGVTPAPEHADADLVTLLKRFTLSSKKPESKKPEKTQPEAPAASK